MTSFDRVMSAIALGAPVACLPGGASAQVAVAPSEVALDAEVEGHLDRAGEALAKVYGYTCDLSDKPEEAAALRGRHRSVSDELDAATHDAETKFGRKMRIRRWASECRTFYSEERVGAALELARLEIDHANALMRSGRAS